MKKSVIVYGTEACPWCAKTRAFLKTYKIQFKDVDVGSDQKAAAETVEKSGQYGVPVIDVNGTILIGFDEQQLRRVLKIKR